MEREKKQLDLQILHFMFGIHLDIFSDTFSSDFSLLALLEQIKTLHLDAPSRESAAPRKLVNYFE